VRPKMDLLNICLAEGVSLTTLQIISIIQVGIVTKLWPTLPIGVTVTGSTTDADTGPLILQLSAIPANITDAQNIIMEAIIKLLGIDSSRLVVTIDPTTDTATIFVDGYTAPTAPTPVPQSESNITVVNITAISHQGNVPLNIGQCTSYTFTIGSNVAMAYIYTALQRGQGIQVWLNNGAVPTGKANSNCSIIIQDNNEYEFTWQASTVRTGSFYGGSSSIADADTCSGGNILFIGQWFATVCATGSNVIFSFEVNLIPLPPSTPTDAPTDDSVPASAVKLGEIPMVLMGIFLMLCFLI